MSIAICRKATAEPWRWATFCNVSAPITVQLIDDAKHSPHLEAADKTLAAITSFIATLPLGAET